MGLVRARAGTLRLCAALEVDHRDLARGTHPGAALQASTLDRTTVGAAGALLRDRHLLGGCLHGFRDLESLAAGPAARLVLGGAAHRAFQPALLWADRPLDPAGPRHHPGQRAAQGIDDRDRCHSKLVILLATATAQRKCSLPRCSAALTKNPYT